VLDQAGYPADDDAAVALEERGTQQETPTIEIIAATPLRMIVPLSAVSGEALNRIIVIPEMASITIIIAIPMLTWSVSDGAIFNGLIDGAQVREHADQHNQDYPAEKQQRRPAGIEQLFRLEDRQRFGRFHCTAGEAFLVFGILAQVRSPPRHGQRADQDGDKGGGDDDREQARQGHVGAGKQADQGDGRR